MKITKVTKLNDRIYAHVCPICGRIITSTTEVDLMPEFSICYCDKIYELYKESGNVMIRRNIYPRFTARVTMGEHSDLEDVNVIDKDLTALELARAMREAADFLIIKSREHEQS